MSKTVFLLQDSEDTNKKLKEKFLESEFEVVGETCDGVLALGMISDKKPDFIITEIVLAGYDGLSVIDKIKQLKLNTKIIVLSVLRNEEVIRKAESLGADYYMVKPYSFEILKERIKELDEGFVLKKFPNKLSEHAIDKRITDIFLSIGMNASNMGYEFLREAIKLVVKDPNIINSVTKKLYPTIGAKYETSASKVERAMRHSITMAWNSDRVDCINKLLGINAFVRREKPTNSEFIAIIADKIKLEEEC